MWKFEDRFMSPAEYTLAIKGDHRHYNCLAFALGDCEYQFMDYMLNDWSFSSIVESFIYKTQNYRIGIEQVQSISEIYGTHGFILFGWIDAPLFSRKGFHVARIEPTGKIVHKLGVKENACETTFEELLKIYPTEQYFFFKYTGEIDPLPAHWR